MGEKRIAEINTMQTELDELIARVCNGIEDKKEEKKCLSRIEKLRRTLSKRDREVSLAVILKEI